MLDLDGLQGGGLAKLQTIGDKIQKVRDAGKKVIAIGSGYTRDQYYLASRADEVIMHELGLVYLEGYEYYRTFFRSALEKLQVDLNVFRVGEFKSFVEPYIRDDMSAEDREASQVWLVGLWAAWERDVAAARKLKPGALQSYADDLASRLEAEKGNAARAAVTAGLVDRLMSRPEVDDYLTELVGESQTDDGTYSAIDFRAYAHGHRHRAAPAGWQGAQRGGDRGVRPDRRRRGCARASSAATRWPPRSAAPGWTMRSMPSSCASTARAAACSPPRSSSTRSRR